MIERREDHPVAARWRAARIVALPVNRWRQVYTEARWGGIEMEELIALRRRLATVGSLAGETVRTARREQMLRSYCWIAWRRLRARLCAPRRTSAGIRRVSGAASMAPQSSHVPGDTHADENARGTGPRASVQSSPGEKADGAGGPRHLVVVGDSLGAGYGEPVTDLELVGWADRVATALRTQYENVRISNLARNGLTTDQIARTQLAVATALRPDLIVLVSGGNDLMSRTWDPDAFRTAYTALLGRLMATDATVITTTWHNVPLAVAMPPALARRFAKRLSEASSVVREVSQALGAPCVDFWQMPALLDAGCYGTDGIHPNARGYLRVAEVLAGALGRHGGLAISRRALRTRAECLLAEEAGGNGRQIRGTRYDITRVLRIDENRQQVQRIGGHKI